MRITLSLPDDLASRFMATVPSGERSATVARLLETELEKQDQEIEKACQAANADAALAMEIDEWQSFDDEMVPE
jgi:metal-responsive CopG/Arc/MetJ family transcriptional regulator